MNVQTYILDDGLDIYKPKILFENKEKTLKAIFNSLTKLIDVLQNITVIDLNGNTTCFLFSFGFNHFLS